MSEVKQTTLWYRNNRERALATQKRRQDRERAKVLEHKESIGCSSCGYNKCGAALDWHHLAPETKDSKDALQVRQYFSDRGVAEREKCILLCSNCHRELHHKERMY